MINTRTNFTTTDQISGGILRFKIIPEIFFAFILSVFTLTAFTPVIFYFYSFRPVRFNLSYAHCFGFNTSCGGRFIKNSFFEGVL